MKNKTAFPENWQPVDRTGGREDRGFAIIANGTEWDGLNGEINLACRISIN
jgi:hypothetical protein